jgi:hypothetical protein
MGRLYVIGTHVPVSGFDYTHYVKECLVGATTGISFIHISVMSS